jgi:hypothetical protein
LAVQNNINNNKRHCYTDEETNDCVSKNESCFVLFILYVFFRFVLFVLCCLLIDEKDKKKSEGETWLVCNELETAVFQREVPKKKKKTKEWIPLDYWCTPLAVTDFWLQNAFQAAFSFETHKSRFQCSRSPGDADKTRKLYVR